MAGVGGEELELDQFHNGQAGKFGLNALGWGDMKFSALARYPATPDRVAQCLTESAFLDRWLAGEQAGDQTGGSTAVVAGAAPGPFTVSIRRQFPVEDLPTQLRHLVPHGLEVRQVNAWEAVGADGARVGTVAVDIPGVPLKLSGSVTLALKSNGESEQRYAIELSATIPLLGARIEQAAAQVIKHSLDLERSAMLAYLQALQ